MVNILKLCLFVCLLRQDLSNANWPQTPCTAKDDILVLLPLLPKGYNYSSVSQNLLIGETLF